MELEKILLRIKSERAALTRFNVKSLAIFGSVARGDAKPESDIDLLVEFEGPATFNQYMGLRIFLEDLLNHPIDLVTRKAIRPQIAPSVEQEAIYVA